MFGTPGWYYIVPAGNDEITARSKNYKPIRPATLNFAVKAALSDDKRMGTETSDTNTAFTDTEKDRACEVLGASRKLYRHNLTLTDNKLPGCYVTIITSSNTPINSLTALFTLNDKFAGTIPATGICKVAGDPYQGPIIYIEPKSNGGIGYTGNDFNIHAESWTSFTALTITDTVTTI